MIVFGWVCLVIIALMVTVALVIGVMVSRGFTGKAGPESWFFLAIAAGAWALVYFNFPFVVVMSS